MRVITCNVNGIRSAYRKGLFHWLGQQHAAVIALQETKAQVNQLCEPNFQLPGYTAYFSDAEKKGYSGVALYLQQPPLRVVNTFDWPLAEQEGRYLRADYADLSVISVYLPSGTSGELRQSVKLTFLDYWLEHLLALRRTQRKLIICGDWNIAHTPKDLKNWRANQKHSGFTPAERAWMDNLLGSSGFVDAFRMVNQESEQYTWWSQRGRAWEKNVGWRIDYQVITPDVSVKSAEIYKAERFSDHAPLSIDYDDLNLRC